MLPADRPAVVIGGIEEPDLAEAGQRFPPRRSVECIGHVE
jgi:hypothetical protein